MADFESRPGPEPEVQSWQNRLTPISRHSGGFSADLILRYVLNRRHPFAAFDQTDRCSVQAAMIGESPLAEWK
jgi:hypothetical protein